MQSSKWPEAGDQPLDDKIDFGVIDGPPVAIWTNHIKDEEERDDFKRVLLSNTRIFGRLRDIIESRYESRRPSVSDFSSPNYSLKRAYDDGYRQALSDIYKILPRPGRGE